MSVLVVDDVAFQCHLIQRTLAQYGHRVHTAFNCDEALSALKTNPDIAVVICDLMMPTLDGIALLEHCRKTLSNQALPRFILLTASTDEAYLQKAQNAGFIEVMSKPVEPSYLSQRLLELLQAEN